MRKGIGTSTLKDKDKLTTTSLAMSCHMHQKAFPTNWAQMGMDQSHPNKNKSTPLRLIRISQKNMHSQAATVDFIHDFIHFSHDFIHDFIHFSHIIPNNRTPPNVSKKRRQNWPPWRHGPWASKISRSWGSISLGVGCRNLSSSDSKISARRHGPRMDAPTAGRSWEFLDG